LLLFLLKIKKSIMKTFYKNILILIFLPTIFVFQSFSQNPLVKQWDYRFGGGSADYLFSLQQTVDGGYIIGGYSNSNIGRDKTQNTWSVLVFDYWIVKTDSLGNKQWDKDFGSTGQDYLTCLKQTVDGGYILGGYSYLGISGNKSQAGYGDWDYWIIKIDSVGNKQWDKDFGGSNYDKLYSIEQTVDRGYILGGVSYSGISGNKTQATWGGDDYWIVKTDSLGNKQWDRDFGGTFGDQLYSVKQTADGGYILGGCSESHISGNKSQTTWGLGDFWILKTDSLGNKQWDQDFGGTSSDVLCSLMQTSDGGYILGGLSASLASGNKTSGFKGGKYDYWIVKTDSLGVKQWDKDFGGLGSEEYFGNISQTSDGGYLFAGTSRSPVGGDKTESNFGYEQTWVLKTDLHGIKQWDKTLQTSTPAADQTGFAIQTKDGCYTMANYTAAGIGGNKSQPCWGGADYWIIKFCDSTLTTSIPIINQQSSIFNIFPNPTTGSIQLTISTKQNTPLRCEIINVLGEKVFETEIKNTAPDMHRDDVSLNVSFLAKGIYLVKVGDGKSWENKKLVIE
jgi:hypothetical protein